MLRDDSDGSRGMEAQVGPTQVKQAGRSLPGGAAQLADANT